MVVKEVCLFTATKAVQPQSRRVESSVIAKIVTSLISTGLCVRHRIRKNEEKKMIESSDNAKFVTSSISTGLCVHHRIRR